MKRRLLSLALILCMMLSLLPAFTIGAAATEHVDHCVCGGSCTTGEHACEQTPAAWTAWEKTDSLPTEAGHYYLTDDVNLADTGSYSINNWTVPDGETSLCLNGKTVNLNGNSITQTKPDSTLNICDCSGGGKITRTATAYSVSAALQCGATAATALNLYGGTIQDSAYTDTPGQAYCALSVANPSTANIYGGTVVQKKTGGDFYKELSFSAISSSGALNLYGGTVKNAGQGFVISAGGNVTLSGAPTITRGGTQAAQFQIVANTTDTLYVFSTIHAQDYTGGTLSVESVQQSKDRAAALTGTLIQCDDNDTNKDNFAVGLAWLPKTLRDTVEAVYDTEAHAWVVQAKPVGPAIAIAPQSGELTCATAGEASYAVTATGFEPVPSEYTVKWYATSSTAETTSAPTDVTVNTNDGTKVVFQTSEDTPAGTYYFTLTSGETESAKTALTVNKKDDNVPTGPEAPAFKNTVAADISDANFYFTTKYAETPTVKVYTSADGDTLTTATVSTWENGVFVSDITAPTKLWVCVVVDGVESARTKITVLPQYTPVDGSSFGRGEYYVNTTTSAGLADYLNYCAPGCATVSGNTVTLTKNVTLFHYLTLKIPDVTLNLNSNTVCGISGTDSALSIGEGTVTAAIKDGAIKADSACVISHEAGSLTLSNVDVTGAVQGVVTGKDLTLTDGSTITIVKPSVSGVVTLEFSAALIVVGGENVKLVNTTIANENTGEGQTPPTLASCIDAGSETAASSQLVGDAEVCSDTITVAVSDPNAPPVWVTSAITSPDDYEYTNTAPKVLKLTNDVSLASPLAPTEDVTIDLNGHTITGAAGENAITASGNTNLLITDTSTGAKGSVTGGAGANGGNGGSAISGGNITVSGGASILGGNGGTGSTGNGGTGGDGVNTTGTVRIESGSAAVGGSGGSGTGSGAGGSGGSGVHTTADVSGAVEVNGAVTGGSGGDGGTASDANADGGNGGTGVHTGSNATVTGAGTVTGGNGGNIPDGNTLGEPGTPGAAVTGGSAASSVTTASGKKGIQVQLDITNPDGTSSITVPTDKIVDAAVTGEEIAQAQAADKTIAVNLTVTPSPDASSGKTAIQNAIRSENATIIYMEVKLEKVVIPAGGGEGTATAITQANALIPFEITLDAASAGKAHYAVLRQHGGSVDTLTETPNAAGEYISVHAAKTVITVYAKKFSTYAIVYSNTPITPTAPVGPTNSSSGGSSTAAAPAPVVVTPTNGTVAIAPVKPTVGSIVTITATPEAGYQLGTVSVTDETGKPIETTKAKDGTYTFQCPSKKVTITAIFASAIQFPFTDVTADDYYFDAVDWAVNKNITGGTTATTFAPDITCARAQTVTFLWRASGSPAPTATENPFTDVDAGAYYYNDVLWAVENGITDGTGKTTFSPNATVTRGQVATFLWRAAGSPTATGVNPFGDVPADAYYYSAVLWAVENGITGGTSATAFSPLAGATRAQILTFLYRYLAN